MTELTGVWAEYALYKVQFNPTRIASSSAKVDTQSIRARACFLCPHHLPAKQRGRPPSGLSKARVLVGLQGMSPGQLFSSITSAISLRRSFNREKPEEQSCSHHGPLPDRPVPAVRIGGEWNGYQDTARAEGI